MLTRQHFLFIIKIFFKFYKLFILKSRALIVVSFYFSR